MPSSESAVCNNDSHLPCQMNQQNPFSMVDGAISSSPTGEIIRHNGGKRKLPPNGDASTLRGAYPRKRAFVACQMCRAKKTKCDNRRPTCGNCQQIDSTCNYPDTTLDHASFDPASLTILDRLNYLIGIVETGAPFRERDGASVVPRLPSSDLGILKSVPDSAAIYLPHLADTLSDNFCTTKNTDSLSRTWPNDNVEAVAGPRTFYGSSEDILDWSVFQSRHDREQIERLIFDPTLHSDLSCTRYLIDSQGMDALQANQNVEPRSTLTSNRGVREEDVLDLIEKFLSNVHTKNPIFDSNVLRGIAKSIAGKGFGWDAETCLVLLACASAAISRKFVRIPITDCTDHDGLDDAPDYAMAEAYYDAARKRIGLLTNTELATECYFLAGVYEMYSLRPLRASISFNRACVAFQALTWMKSERSLNDGRLEKAKTSRLYWSCLKSEHEIMIELRFPPSGLTTLNYTQSFPSPPTTSSSDVQNMWQSPEDLHTGGTSSQSLEPELERAWYYYLADIAVRRILQRVFDQFYRTSHRAWLQQDMSNLVWSAEELDQQLIQWYNNLPNLISSVEDVPADEELSFHLQARAAEVRERIYRPFLFLAIHRPAAANQEPGVEARLAQRHILACLRLIRHWNVSHRHHGTWLMVRQSFAAGLLLVAAYRAGLTLGGISETDFKEALRTCLSTLRHWEREAPDLRASRLILEDMTAGLLD